MHDAEHHLVGIGQTTIQTWLAAAGRWLRSPVTVHHRHRKLTANGMAAGDIYLCPTPLRKTANILL